MLLRKRGGCTRRFANTRRKCSTRIGWRARPVTELAFSRAIAGWMTRIMVCPGEHEGNRNSSAEEVEVVARIAREFGRQASSGFGARETVVP